MKSIYKKTRDIIITMKQKIDISDIINLLNHLKNNIINNRIINIYDINNKSFLIKLVSKDKIKKFIILDSNSNNLRFHETEIEYERRKLPSSFCVKLRKHLKNKIINNITQIGSDRIIDIEIGTDKKFHLILELFDNGNLFLTDHDYNIIILLRIFTYNDNTQVKVGNKYSFSKVNHNDINLEILDNYIKNYNLIKKKSLRDILLNKYSPIVNYGKDIIIHCLLSLNLKPNKKLTKIENFNIQLFFEKIIQTYNLIKFSDKGYMFYKNNIKEAYSSIILNQYKDLQVKSYESLNKVLDIYYDQKQIIKKKKIKEKKNKEENIKLNTDNKISKLQDRVDNYIIIINLLENKFNIDDYEIIEKNEKDKFMILKDNDIKFKYLYELNIWNNIKYYYGLKKDLLLKIDKTKLGYQTATKKFKNKKVNKINYIKPTIEIKQFWFQKFKWFITSDNYLVILGKNDTDNELIVNKYMTKNDIYIHSDSYGSGSAIIKNIIQSNTDIPSFRALREAVCFVVCHSKSWKNKIFSNGFWVYSSQVSQTPESGEYLSKGSFIIRGKKNYIIPNMILGFGIKFKREGNLEIENLVNSGDKIEWVIPILSPWESLKDLKYKVKLVPGNNKINKSLNIILNKFLKQDGSLLEKSLIKYCNKGLMLSTIISNINIK